MFLKEASVTHVTRILTAAAMIKASRSTVGPMASVVVTALNVKRVIGRRKANQGVVCLVSSWVLFDSNALKHLLSSI
jgi:hypothetical protein